MVEIPPTRESLLVRLRDARDEAAWSRFVDLYAPLVYGYARKRGLQDADAADLAQDVLTAVARGVGRLEYDPRRGAFRNWLFTIVRRKLSNRLRAGHSRLDTGCEANGDLLSQVAAQPEVAQWEAEWEQRRFAWACDQVRRNVSEATWQAFWRTAVEGRPGKQVAASLGVTVAAVYHSRSRVLARLKELVHSAQEE